jgi:uncharacterized protein YyaL (SSP411 family)
LAAVLAGAAGCHLRGGAEGTAAPRCEAPRILPGSTPLPPGVVSSIATAEVPAQALLRRRRVCNRLALEPDTFARQHALDAIDWREWSPATLAEAVALDRPLFVLTGFASCAACRDLATGPMAVRRLARTVNRNFVPVIVDREERPDVDAYLMQAVQVLTGGAGWPSVVFLEPDLRPFAAQSWGAAGSAPKPLDRMVEEIRRRISLGGGSINEKAELTLEKMQRRVTLDTTGPLPDATATAASLRGYLADSFDAQAGSFGPPPLFPRAPVLDFLTGLPASDGRALEMAATSLERLRAGAMFDAADGGFRRYARQASWQEPVSEKMLADNAALASAYLRAAARTGRADLRDTAKATIEFLLTRLVLENGAFAASIDTGVAVAGDSANASDATGAANEHGSARDDLVLADANALAISALVRAANVLGQPRYMQAAVAAATRLDSLLRDGGRVIHCVYPDDRRCADGYLSDQALTALAFLDLDEAGAPGQGRWLDAARTIADAMPERFGHEAGGGFFLTADDAAPLPLRFQPALDGAVPCGNSAAAWLYVRLAARTKDERYRVEARRTFEAFSEVLTLRPLALPSMVAALVAASAPPQLEPAPAVQP